LKKWHILLGPLLWRRGEVPPRPADEAVVEDYYRGHHTKNGPAPVDENATDHSHPTANDVEKRPETQANLQTASSSTSEEKQNAGIEGPWYTPKNIFIRARYYFFRGVNRDVVAEQSDKRFTNFLTGNLNKMHAEVKHYDNKTEHLYSLLQVMTAATASFAHGSNDVSNAIGPLSTIYLIWNSGIVSKKADVPIWVLVFGGAAISK
jgi:sodium-dependent phosphate transporter